MHPVGSAAVDGIIEMEAAPRADGDASQSARSSYAYNEDSIRTGTVIGTTINTLCNVMGAGVLALPFAIHHGSVATSLLLLALTAFVAYHATLLLAVGCDYVKRYSYTEVTAFTLIPMSDKEKEEARAGADTSLDNRWRRLVTLAVELIIVLSCWGTLVVYTRIIADSMPPVLYDFFSIKDKFFVLLLAVIIPNIIFFVLSCSRSMEELKWTSLIGFVTILYIVIMVIIRFFTTDSYLRFHKASNVRWLSVDIGLFATLSTFALAFSYQFNVPYFYRELIDRRPSTMMQSVRYSFPIITVSYFATGLLGYLTFGDRVAGPSGGNVVDLYKRDDFLMNIGRAGLLLHFATVYPVVSITARRGLHRFIAILATQSTAMERSHLANRQAIPVGDPAATRYQSIVIEAAVLVLTAAATALTVPGVGVVIELIGALFGIPCVFIIPGLIGYIVMNTRLKQEGAAPWLDEFTEDRVVRNAIISILMILFGVFFSLLGLFGAAWSYRWKH